MTKHDSKTTWIKWFTIDFCVFFSKQYFARKLRSKVLAQEYYDWKMIEPKINTKTWFKIRSIKLEP